MAKLTAVGAIWCRFRCETGRARVGRLRFGSLAILPKRSEPPRPTRFSSPPPCRGLFLPLTSSSSSRAGSRPVGRADQPQPARQRAERATRARDGVLLLDHVHAAPDDRRHGLRRGCSALQGHLRRAVGGPQEQRQADGDRLLGVLVRALPLHRAGFQGDGLPLHRRHLRQDRRRRARGK